MKRRIFTSLAATAAVAASILISGATPAVAQPAADSSTAARSAGVTQNSQLPLDSPIRVDDTKFKVVATLKGIGKQVYSCGTSGTYALREPVAGVFDLRGNPGIPGKGPFWAGVDGSRVDITPGTTPESVPQKGTSNVAWLKVTATPVPNAPGVFGNVAFIQRLDTKGGVAPASCTAPTVSVDYSANYVFWAPKP